MALIDPYTFRDPPWCVWLGETVLRVLSRTSPLGRCRECGISWAYREPMPSVAYRYGSAAAPLCQRCFDALDAEAVTTHFQQMWQTDWNRAPDEDATLVFHANVRDRKEQNTDDHTHD